MTKAGKVSIVLVSIALGGFLLNGLLPEASAGSSQAKPKAPAGLVSHYLQIQKALAADRFDGVKQPALKLISAAAQEGDFKDSERTEIKKAALLVAKAKDLSVAREKFKRLSKPIVKWVEKTRPKGVEIAYCPMAGAKWVQGEGPLRNPYYGSQMLECGEKIH